MGDDGGETGVYGVGVIEKKYFYKYFQQLYNRYCFLSIFVT
jgi:hypothetical protein